MCVVFVVASLLSQMHQLKSENARLEEHVKKLTSYRDHLLATNARLAVPFTVTSGTSDGDEGTAQSAKNSLHLPNIAIPSLPPIEPIDSPNGVYCLFVVFFSTIFHMI
jgi:hypothetical protein